VELDEERIAAMSTPEWEKVRTALHEGNLEAAEAHLDAAVERWRRLQDYSISWIAQLLSFVGRQLGEPAVEEALREFGDDYIRPRNFGEVDWNALPARTRARAIASMMVANFGTVDVEEDAEKITLSFRCGTGGRLIDEGRYEGDGALLTLTERAPRTFDRDALPVYCAHCSVNNELQAIEATGYPVMVEHPPTAPGQPCVHHVYKDLDAVPEEAYRRVGQDVPRG
jgi:hypothetical protein